LGFEHLSFEQAIDQEAARLDGETQKIIQDERYQSVNHRHFSYLSRGVYIDQIKNWLEVFPREQILIAKSEDFFESPQILLGKVLSWLNLPEWDYPKFRVHNRLEYQKINPITQDRLHAYFEPYNNALYDFLGVNFGWNAPSGYKDRSTASSLV